MDKNDFFPWTQIPATFPVDISGHNFLMNCSHDLNFYNTSSNWGYPLDQNDNFESALSSMVSSPAASVAPAAVHGDGVQLIGKLGSICSRSDISNYCNNSSYSTPANSPQKLNLATLVQMRGKFPPLSPLATDPGFSERAARLSCFGSRSFNEGITSQRLVSDQVVHGSQLNRIDHIQENKVLENRSDSKEKSSVSQKMQSNEGIEKKRKAIVRGKAKNTSKVGVENKESDSKRGKIDEVEKCGKSDPKKDSQPPEPPKDYIHVRARRGQATNSHSLAERVRREKISERMKFLQDLVPGCNKVTGKAVMLDEIINYVQLLQRQVECLLMKLATVNPIMDDAHLDALLSKEMLQPHMYSMESSNSASASVAFPYTYQSQEPPCLPNGNSFNDDHLWQSHHHNLQLQSINGSSNSTSQVSMCADVLHNVVRMGFPSGSMEPSQMKMEP